MRICRLFTTRFQDILFPILGIALIAIIWQLVHQSEIFEPTLLPSVPVIFDAFVKLIFTGNILPDLGMTLGRTICGFGLAALVGVPLGISMGMFRPVYRCVLPLVDFFRSIPVTTLYPIFVLTLGVRDKSKIGMIFAGCVFIVMLNSAYGVLQASLIRRQMANLYGCSGFKLVRWVTFYETLPQTLIGLRVALSLALVVSVLGEMFMGCEYGLGQRLTDAYTTFSVDRMYALVIVTGLLGFILNRIFVRIEKALVPWAGT
jgi:ABC-type nitrate/sulfonate/bicarbonate transport system permease component